MRKPNGSSDWETITPGMQLAVSEVMHNALELICMIQTRVTEVLVMAFPIGYFDYMC